MDPTAITTGINSGSTTWAVIAVVGMFLMLAKDIFKIFWQKREEREADGRTRNLPDDAVREQTEQILTLKKNGKTMDSLAELQTRQIIILQSISNDLRAVSENQKEYAKIMQTLNTDHIRLFVAMERVLEKVA